MKGRRCIVFRDSAVAAREAEVRKGVLQVLWSWIKNEDNEALSDEPFLVATDKGKTINKAKVRADALMDGLFFIETNTAMPAAEVVEVYGRVKQAHVLLESGIRAVGVEHAGAVGNSLQRGQLAVAFLGLTLVAELQRRLRERGESFDWNEIRRDLMNFIEVEASIGDLHYTLRTSAGAAGARALAAVGSTSPG